MHKIILSGLIICCFSATAIEAGWVQLGESLNIDTGAAGNSPDIAVSGDAIYVVWSENDAVYVKKYNGANWELLGNSLAASVEGVVPSITTYQGTPYIAWTGFSGSEYQVFASEYNGSAWNSLGGLINNDPDQSVAGNDIIVLNGIPYVAWSEMVGSASQVYVKHFNGSQWIQDGGSLNLNPDYSAESPRMSTYAGNVYVSWIEGVDIYAKRLYGTQWETMGGRLNISSGPYAGNPDITLDQTSGTPYVAWAEWVVRGSQIYVAKYVEPNWLQVGSHLNSDTSIQADMPSIVQDANEIYVSFIEDEQYKVKKYNSNVWEDLNIDENATGGYLRMDAGNGRLSVAGKAADSAPGLIFVKQYIPPTPTSTASNTISPTPTMTPTQTKMATVSVTITMTSLPVYPNGSFAVPNPFLPALGQSTRIIFGLEKNLSLYTIHIMNQKGQAVRVLKNEQSWDGRSDTGHLCEGGVYIYQIEAEGKRVTGKVVLIK